MYNMYTSSATRRASLSFSFNDCPEICSSSFNGGCTSSSCCCCCCSCNCCSSIPTSTVFNSPRLVSINPSPFYGFRQSTLIQLPLSRRRLILGAPIGDLGPSRSSTYGRLDCIRDRIRDEGMKSKQKGMGLWGYYSGVEERYAFGKVSDACDDAEAMISLLSEGLGEGDERRRKKRVSLSKKGKVSEGNVEERVVVREERVYGRRLEGCLWDELENVGARGWKEKLRLRKGGSIGSSYYPRMKWHEECAEDSLVGSEKESRKRVVVVTVNKQATEKLRLRKGGSIGSSYYPRMKWHEECAEDSLVGSEKESRKRVGVVTVNKQAKDELERRRIEKDQCLESVRIDDKELKKKSKKKIRKELIEETASGKKSVLNQSRLSEAHVSGSEMGSSMRKQYSYRVGESVSDVKSSFGHSRADNRVSKTSDSRYKHEPVTVNSAFVDKLEHVVSVSEVCRTCGQVTSGSQAGSSNEQLSKFTQIQCNSAGISSNEQQSRQEVSSSLMQKSAKEVNQQHKQEHLVASNQIDLRKSENYTERADAAESYEENTSISRRRAKLSEIENTDSRLTSTVRQQSGTRIKKQEGASTLYQASLKKEDERSHQERLVAISQTELIRKSQKRIEIVDTGSSIVQDTYRTQQQQEAQVKGSEENTVLISSQVSKGKNYQTDIQVKGSEENTVLISSQLSKGENYQTDVQVKGSEENTVLISSQLSKGENYQTDIQVTTQKQSRKESKVLSSSSHVHFGETIVNSSKTSDERSHSEQTYLIEKVKETREHVKETIKQTELRYEVQTPLREPSIVKESSRYPYVTSTSQVRLEEVGEEEDVRNFPSGPSPSLVQPHVKEAIKQTELRYEVHTPVRKPSIVMKETSRYPYVTSTSQVRIEEIGEKEDERNLPSRPSPRLPQPPQSIEVHPVSIESARIEESGKEEDERNFPSGPSPSLAQPHVKKTIKQTELRFEVHTPVRESIVKKETGRYPYVTSTSQVRIEEIGKEEDERNLSSGPSPRLARPPPSIEVHPVSIESARIEEIGEEEDEINLPSGPSPRLAQPPQSIELHPVSIESASRFSSQDSPRSSEGESSIYIDPLATDALPNVDLLGSAERMDSSYHRVIGDFVENIRHGESTSVIEMEKKLPKRQLLSEEVGFTHEESVQSDTENVNMVKECSRFSSGSGTGKDPLATDAAHVDLLGSAERMDDSYHQVIGNFVENIRHEESTSVIEMEKKLPKRQLVSEGSGTGKESTDETSTLQQPPEREASENAETRNGIARRSGRALWNVVANIVRLRWNVLAESHKSNVKSGGQSSLSNSTVSESLFSGYSSDVQGGNMDLGTLIMPLEPSSTYQQPLLALTMGGNSALSPSFGGVSGEATVPMDWTQSAGRHFRRSHRRSDAIYELQEGGTEATGSGTGDWIKGDLDPSLSVVSGSEENVVELNRRNLLRSNQVMKERFDEWGEAYRVESEQRKIDETFMREALEEAKKAAEVWEYPVGAVLVQDGKIIARGHNLVEDSRDSTAHAEIVCIREASSILKTWRLSETALYVTLEPCAMCAGAILQARVGTLVYGAPNRLLGADGSWVRLFPGSSSSVDGEGGPESTAKPEGPVHPFHPKMVIRRGILEAECAELMQRSFKLRRKKDKKTEQPDEKRSNRKVLNPSKLLHKMHHMFLFC